MNASPYYEPLPAAARELALRARLTSEYAKDGSFRCSVNQVLAYTQHVSDRAVDELLDELSEREKPPAPPADRKSPSLTGLYVLLGIFAAGGIVAGVAEVMAWWHVAFSGCHL